MRDGYSPDHLPLLWPPAWEAQANAEGWTLREAGGIVEVDYVPPRSSPEPIYHHLIGWIVLNIALGSRMHAIAWEFEYAANRAIYTDGKVPGDSMFLVYDEATDTTVWREWPFDDTAAEWPR